MATRGNQFSFHGAFSKRADAEKKLAKLGGTKKARILGRYVNKRSYRYVVVTK